MWPKDFVEETRALRQRDDGSKCAALKEAE
jgi:hypothetical protein